MPLPAYIAADFVAEAQAIVETLEGVYSAHAIDAAKAAAFVLPVAVAPAVAATTPAVTAPVSGLYAAMKALWAAIPLLVSDVTGVDPSLAQGCLALARGLGQAMDPGDAAAAFALAADSAADPEAPLPGWTANRVIDNSNAAILARLSRAVYLSPYVEALVTRVYATRADAITAKADCVARFERELDLCGLGLGPDIAFADALTAMRDAAVDYLGQTIANAKPVLTVTVPLPVPVLVAAWRIYADPGRAGELIDRNGVRVAEFLQTTFEAMAA